MCGRYSIAAANDTVLLERYNVSQIAGPFEKRYNISPSQNVYAVLNEDPGVIFQIKWGLVPFWAKDPEIGQRMINARAEGIAAKPSFRGPIRSRRCLIIADGFYEWKKEASGGKRPFRITMKDKSIFSFAGIWDIWGKEGSELYTCSIITTAANALVSQVHDRMPVILRREDEGKWLSEKDLTAALGLLKPYDGNEMAGYEISTLVNSPANNTEEIMRRTGASLN